MDTETGSVTPGTRAVGHDSLQDWIVAARYARLDLVWLRDALVGASSFVDAPVPIDIGVLSTWSHCARMVAQQLLAMADSMDEVRQPTPMSVPPTTNDVTFR